MIRWLRAETRHLNEALEVEQEEIGRWEEKERQIQRVYESALYLLEGQRVGRGV